MWMSLGIGVVGMALLTGAWVAVQRLWVLEFSRPDADALARPGCGGCKEARSCSEEPCGTSQEDGRTANDQA